MSKSRKIVSAVLIFFFIIAAGCTGYFAYEYFSETAAYEQHEDDLVNVKDAVVKEPVVDDDVASGIDPNDPICREVNFDELLSINEDATRWVYVPDSTLDYPVMQERTVGYSYYLWRDIYKKSSKVGSVLTPAIPMNIDDPHIMFFGHSFGNDRDAMFYTVKKYYDMSYFDTHPYVYVYYPDKTEKWLAIEVRNLLDSDIVYNVPYTYGSEDYAELQRHLFADYRQQLTDKLDGITADDPLLILSSCDRKYDRKAGRAILICRLAAVLDKSTGEIAQIYPVTEGE